jgi:HSP20 family protein
MAKKRSLLWFEEPVDEFRRMQEDFFDGMQRMFKKPFLNSDKLIKAPDFKSRFIPIKMADSDNELILKAEMLGFSKDEINLKVTPKTFFISAEKKRQLIEKNEKFFRAERDFGSTSRLFTLPEEVKTEGIKAKFENGVLEVIMKKKDAKKEKEVEID